MDLVVIDMREQSPLVSIGVPLFNAEKYIRQALDCLLAQTYKNFEIIISDNFSTDRTADIIKEYRDRDNRIKVFLQPENRGGAENFQFVLEQSVGTYFMWRSYDDWSDDNYLEQLVLLLEQRSEIDLAVGSLVLVNEGAETPIHTEPMRIDNSQNVFSQIELLKCARSFWIYGVFRREIALEMHTSVRKNYDYTWASDHLTIFPIVLNGAVGFCPETRFFQRQTGISGERYRARKAGDQIKVAKSFYLYCLRILMATNASFWRKTFLALYLLKYTSSRTEKFTRTLRIMLKLRRK